MESATSLDVIANGLTGFGHPIRIRALVLLEHEQTPKDLHVILGEPLGVVSYHVRMLRQYGLVIESRTEPRRGAVAHYYVRTDLAVSLLRALGGLLDLPPMRGRGAFANRAELLAEWAANGNGQPIAA
jgi:DNA-binding transcriptional ArsR family regulator